MSNIKHVGLATLNHQIKDVVKRSFPGAIWVVAEIAQLQENISGHCYLDLVEKEESSNKVLARNKATIWAYTYRMLKPFFETSTRQAFTSGLKVLVKVTVEYHEQYGISLNIKDIDPSYTVGELAVRRQQTIEQLQNDGVFEMNKELELPVLTQRLAIISSATAAGYDDFMDQLMHTDKAIAFTSTLFQATMQGENAAASIVEAFDRIYDALEQYDVVVVIRGGGASMDLSCFDNYDLAYYATQFPKPIITGIGHERDESVLDLVAHTALKTPTAVATYLVDSLAGQLAYVEDMEAQILQLVEQNLSNAKHNLQIATQKIPVVARQYVSEKKQNLLYLTTAFERLPQSYLQQNKERLLHIEHSISKEMPLLLTGHKNKLNHLLEKTRLAFKHKTQHETHKLEMYAQIARSADPQNVLKKGYSITTLRGKVLTSASSIQKGDRITTRLYEGEITSIVEPKK